MKLGQKEQGKQNLDGWWNKISNEYRGVWMNFVWPIALLCYAHWHTHTYMGLHLSSSPALIFFSHVLSKYRTNAEGWSAFFPSLNLITEALKGCSLHLIPPNMKPWAKWEKRERVGVGVVTLANSLITFGLQQASFILHLQTVCLGLWPSYYWVFLI